MRPWLTRLRARHVGFALIFAVVAMCGVSIVRGLTGPSCDEHIAAIAARLHDNPRPVAEELAPLAPVTEVHWVQEIDGVACGFAPGSLSYDRTGVALLSSEAVDRLRAGYQWYLDDPAGVVVDDSRLTAWLPADPHWQESEDLDARFQPKPYGGATYHVDLAHGVVVFTSFTHYDKHHDDLDG